MKIFNTGSQDLDNLLSEVYYSGIEDGYDYAQKEFTRRDIGLENSHRGLGRSLIIGGLPGAAAAYTTKDEADDDWRRGVSEHEIVTEAGKKGATRGAIIGGALGTASGITTGLATASATDGDKATGAVLGGLAGGLSGAGFGSLGGYLGARKNAKTRILKTALKYGDNREDRERDRARYEESEKAEKESEHKKKSDREEEKDYSELGKIIKKAGGKIKRETKAAVKKAKRINAIKRAGGAGKLEAVREKNVNELNKFIQELEKTPEGREKLASYGYYNGELAGVRERYYSIKKK